jgi:DNA topoisomerase III
MDEEAPLGLSIRGNAVMTVEKKGRRKKAVAGAKKKVAKRSETKTDDSPLIAALKEWRRAQAKKQGVPSFRIMSDRVLLTIADDQPVNLAELMAVPGIGPKTVEKYGAQIYKIVNQTRL